MSLDHQMACNGMASSFFSPANFILQMQSSNNEDHEHQHQPPNSSTLTPFLPTNPQDFRGMATMLSKRSMSFCGMEPCEKMNGDDDLSDDCSQAGEKKIRRLNMEQVRTLEKNFELGNKLEPERKMQLARALGLQPRQIAIWFQNRRARWKTKQLEKDFDVLKRQFESLRSENEDLQSHNKKLQAEISALKGSREASEPINLNKETEGSCSNRSENSSEINLSISRTSVIESHHLNHQQGIRPFFTSISRPVGSRTELNSPLKIEQCAPDDNFCNIFCNIDDQSAAFWAWSENHNFH